MVKNPLIKFEKIKTMMKELKIEKESDEIFLEDLRMAIAKEFDIIDYVAMKRFIVSLDKLGFIKPSSTNKVKICI